MATQQKTQRPLTAKQERFAAEYLVDLNATQAAIRAGYSAKTAQEQGSRLLSNVMVRNAIAERQSKQLKAIDADGERTKRELAALAFIDIRGLYREDGSLKAMHELTPEQGAALASVETVVQGYRSERETVRKVRLWDKLRALEMLAKHFGLLVDRIHVTGEVELVVGRLAAARKRLAERNGGDR